MKTTLRKIKPKAKEKRKNRVNSIIVSKSKYTGSGIGETTLNDGLEFGNYAYGTRVQDDQISLNVPDVLNVLAVYESSSSADPSLPNLKLTSFTGPTNNNQDF